MFPFAAAGIKRGGQEVVDNAGTHETFFQLQKQYDRHAPGRRIGFFQCRIGRFQLLVGGHRIGQGIDVKMLMRRLAEPDIMIDRIAPMGDRFDGHDPLARHLLGGVAAKLAEGTFVAGFRRNRQLAFEHILRQRRHFEIQGPAFDDIHRFPGQAAGDFQFVDTDTRFELRSDVNRRRHADTDSDFKLFLAALLGILHEVIAVVPRRKTNRHLVLRHQHHPVNRQVHAVLGIFENHMAGGDIRSAVARIVGAQWQFCDVDVVPFHDHFLTWPARHPSRRHRFIRPPHSLIENIFLR